MKKVIVFLLTTCFVFGIGCGPCSAATIVNVYVNNEFVDADQQAMVVNGRTLVPLRAICEALNCTVDWDGSTRTIQIQNEVTIISLQIDNYLMTKVDRENQANIQTVQLDVPPVIYNNTTMVPARAIAEALYAVVQWDGNKNRVDITLEFDTIGWFRDGKAAVSKDGKYGLINEKRDVLVPVIYDDISWYHQDELVWVEQDGKEGYVDTRGNVVVPIIYDIAWPFSDERAVVISWMESGAMEYGVVDNEGKQIVPFDEYNYIEEYSEGLAMVKSNGRYHKSGFIDKNGNLVIPMIYDAVESFSDGVAVVLKDNTLFYIDKHGNVAVTPEIAVNSAEGFSEGLAAVENNGKWGYIDKSGKIVIPMIYDNRSDFSDGRALVSKDGKKFLIDKNGNRVD